MTVDEHLAVFKGCYPSFPLNAVKSRKILNKNLCFYVYILIKISNKVVSNYLFTLYIFTKEQNIFLN